MVFASVEFLFFFLPVVFAVYFFAPKKLKNISLLLASLVFYSWGGGKFLLILLVSIVADYSLGFLADYAFRSHRVRLKRLGVTLSVLVNISLLGYFKYANFFVNEFNNTAERLGLGEVSWTAIALPIGISFFTFQSMSYTIDVSRGAVKHLRNPVDFAMYVALFPQLIAGPIVRFHELADQISARVIARADLAEGAVRFIHGLVKKVVVADAVAVVADAAFASSPGQLSSAEAWIGALAYTVQIYFDFSGYSDMAIGLGRMFGFRFPENFNRPYSAVSITDFWRRWHMTLSNWFRDYVYLPLGGSRRGSRRTYANLTFVFLVTGFWHGANWTFVVWGLYHGVLLTIERITGQRALGDGVASHSWLRRAYVMAAVIGGWVIFRADSISHAINYLRAMVPVGGFGSVELFDLSNRTLLMLVVGLSVVLVPATFSGPRLLTQERGWLAGVARFAAVTIAFPYSAALILSGSFSPFLYFQF